MEEEPEEEAPAHVVDREERVRGLFNTWFPTLKVRLGVKDKIPTPSSVLKKKVCKMSGDVLSWAFIAHANAVAIKWEDGILYFSHVVDLKSLPYWYVRDLSMIEPPHMKYSSHLSMFVSCLERECNQG